MGFWGSPVYPIPRSGNGLSSGVEEAICEEVRAWGVGRGDASFMRVAEDNEGALCH